jgi:S-adenosylmethionine synthetase
VSKSNFLFTSESVSEGHPDKVCDQISDKIVDTYLKIDNEARVAVETLCTSDRIVLAGEIKVSDAKSMKDEIFHENLREAVNDTLCNIGYGYGNFHWDFANFDINIHNQSPDIASGVDMGGAGDQGIMFGYACDETDVMMPAPIYYSHKILKSLADARHSKKEWRLGPDAKSQVTFRYENGRPVQAESIVVSTQHIKNIDQGTIKEIVYEHVVNVLPDGMMCSENNFYVNPTGKFEIGGPNGDTGLTGRKIIVDTYGGAAPHGGGAFSGKDSTKVDRSAAYIARYLAKNVVAANLAKKCVIQLSYGIGISNPLSFNVDTLGTSTIINDKDDKLLSDFLEGLVDLSPRGIRAHLNLNRPIYFRTAVYGHFGRDVEPDGGFSWEKLDLVDRLKKEFS